MMLLASVTVHAYDFSVVLSPTQTIYFNIVDGGVEVVYPSASEIVSNAWNGYTKPTGALTVPPSVTYGDTVYAVVSVGHYAFRQCTGLTSVILSEGLATVDTGAFYGCTGVSTLALPSTVAWIGNGAFTQLSSLAEVWSLAAVPPTTTGNVFNGVSLASCTLHVPCGATAAYAAASPWSFFGTTVDEPCEVHVGVLANDSQRGSVAGGGSYPVGTTVMLTAIPADGYSFICWNDGDTLNPRLVQATDDVEYTAMFFALSGVVYVHDTVRDTLMPTFYTLSVLSDNTQLGVGVGSAVLPAGMQVEVCGLPMEGCRFVSWDDGVTDNPRRVALTADRTLRALFERIGVKEVVPFGWTVTTDGCWLVVDGVEGRLVRLYDIDGRLLVTQASSTARLTLTLSAAGVYLVQVDDGPARKIVIDR